MGERLSALGGAVLVAAAFLPWNSVARGYELDAAGLFGLASLAGGAALLLAGTVPAIARSALIARSRRTVLAATAWSAFIGHGAMIFADDSRGAVYIGAVGGLLACTGTAFWCRAAPSPPPAGRVTLGDARGLGMAAGGLILILSTFLDWWAFWGPWDRAVFGMTGPTVVLVALTSIAVPVAETAERRAAKPIAGVGLSARQLVWILAAGTALWALAQWFREGSQTGTIVALAGAVTVTLAAWSPPGREGSST